jgi:hypothetical protein
LEGRATIATRIRETKKCATFRSAKRCIREPRGSIRDGPAMYKSAPQAYKIAPVAYKRCGRCV